MSRGPTPLDAPDYTAADAFTIGNACCGTICIFLCLDYVADGRPAASYGRRSCCCRWR